MGWTWDYLHNGIAWNLVQRIMTDLPSYSYKGKNDDNEIKLNNENAQDIMNYINMMG